MARQFPKITVVTPTYNRAKYIKETIESVLKQTFKDFEYLILDDGSTDNTEEIIKPYLKDQRVKYLRHKNSGEAKTTNWGWKIAKGEYFTQVNSDDPILKNLFSEMIKILDKEKNIVVAYPSFYFINDDGKIIKKIKNKDWNFTEALSTFSCYAASPGTFIRKTAFKNWGETKDNKLKYINDIDMYWNMALKGDFKHVPKFLATWREHEGGISFQRHKSMPEIYIWFKKFFSKKNLPKEIRSCKIRTRLAIFFYEYHLLKNSYQNLNLNNKIKCLYFGSVHLIFIPFFLFTNTTNKERFILDKTYQFPIIGHLIVRIYLRIKKIIGIYEE